MDNKPKYDPNVHHRRSIRLKGYDYSQKGLYFVTIVVRNRLCLFGEIINQEMILNDAGNMIGKWYFELQNKFADIICNEKIVMPNHFHCIIENTGMVFPTKIGLENVGADLCVRPDSNNARDLLETPNMEEGQTRRSSPTHTDGSNILGDHTGSPLSQTVQWFKTMSTNEYIRNVKSNNWPRFDSKLWQRNYYEHIIRNEKSYHAISEYIINNPKSWGKDFVNPINQKKA
ncbi:MAG: transposase [Ferruginibacter sp.]